ncbi:MAG: protein kinase, partial [Planctomycetota bacterium]
MLATQCPTQNRLQEYLSGKLDEGDSAVLEEHLANCEHCERTADALESNESDPSLGECEDSIVKLLQSQPAPALESADAQSATSARSIQPILAPSQVGSYDLLQQIGSGGMGAVYLARHQSLEKQVALKLLPAIPGRSPELVARFQREIKTAGKLDHPAIVRTTDAGEENGIHYLVMEAIDGLDLSRIAKATGKFRVADACEVIRQTALGLTHAHAQGIVHRDIKPSNLMLDEQGQVRILDFGLAQIGVWDNQSAEITSVGQLMGTLDYMAPEQAERGGSVDYRADLYSLGATLYRLLTGRGPLAAAPDLTPMEKLRLLATHSAPKLKTLRADAPEELCQVVDQLVRRNPAERPASAAHVAEQLEPFCIGSTLEKILATARENETNNDSRAFVEPLQSPPELDTGLPGKEKSSGRSFLRFIMGAALLACLTFGFWFVLETSKGQLVIESESDVSIRIVEEDSDKVVDELQIEPGTKVTRLKSGKYEIVIDAPSDRYRLSFDTFTIRNGQTVVARVTQGRSGFVPDLRSTKTAGDPDYSASQYTYEGKTLDEWLHLIQYDRSPGKSTEALIAVRSMASPDTREIIEPILLDLLYRNPSHASALAVGTLSKLYGDGVWDRLVDILEDEDAVKNKLFILAAIAYSDQGEHALACSEPKRLARLLDWSEKQFLPSSVATEQHRAVLLDALKAMSASRGGIQMSESSSEAVLKWLAENSSQEPNSWLELEGDSGMSPAPFRSFMRDQAIQTLGDFESKADKLLCFAARVLESTTKYANTKFSRDQELALAKAIDRHLKRAINSPEVLKFNFRTPKDDPLFPSLDGVYFMKTGYDWPTHPLLSMLVLVDKLGLDPEDFDQLENFHEMLKDLPIGENTFFSRPKDLNPNSGISLPWEDTANRNRYQQVTFERQVFFLVSGSLLGKTQDELFRRFSEQRDTDVDFLIETAFTPTSQRATYPGSSTVAPYAAASTAAPRRTTQSIERAVKLVQPRHKAMLLPLVKKNLKTESLATDKRLMQAQLRAMYQVDPEGFLSNYLECALVSSEYLRDVLFGTRLGVLPIQLKSVEPALELARTLKDSNDANQDKSSK